MEERTTKTDKRKVSLPRNECNDQGYDWLNHVCVPIHINLEKKSMFRQCQFNHHTTYTIKKVDHLIQNYSMLYVWTTLAKFGPHAGNTKFNTTNEEWISIPIIICIILPVHCLYIMNNKNILMIIWNIYKNAIINWAHFYKMN